MVRVYHHTNRSFSLIPKLRRLQVGAKEVTSDILGEYLSSFKGYGLEFEEYRKYEPGHDDAKQIDWKASKRANDLLVKTFNEERNLNVFIAVDVSASMRLGTSKLLKWEYAAEIAASLSYAILEASDSVGYCLFNEDIVEKAKPEMSKRQFHDLCIKLLNEKNYGGGKNLTNVFRYLLSFLPSHSVVIIISDFIGVEHGWEKYLRIAGYKFDLIGIMVRDPLDEELPTDKGQVVLEHPFDDRQLVVVPHDVKTDYKHEAQRIEKSIHETFRKANADTVRLRTTDPFVHSLRVYFKKRRMGAT